MSVVCPLCSYKLAEQDKMCPVCGSVPQAEEDEYQDQNENEPMEAGEIEYDEKGFTKIIVTDSSGVKKEYGSIDDAPEWVRDVMNNNSVSDSHEIVVETSEEFDPSFITDKTRTFVNGKALSPELTNLVKEHYFQTKGKHLPKSLMERVLKELDQEETEKSNSKTFEEIKTKDDVVNKFQPPPLKTPKPGAKHIPSPSSSDTAKEKMGDWLILLVILTIVGFVVYALLK